MFGCRIATSNLNNKAGTMNKKKSEFKLKILYFRGNLKVILAKASALMNVASTSPYKNKFSFIVELLMSLMTFEKHLRLQML